MTNEQRKTAIEWLQEEIRSLRLAPKINGCGPENCADLLEIMETCLEAVRAWTRAADAGAVAGDGRGAGVDCKP